MNLYKLFDGGTCVGRINIDASLKDQDIVTLIHHPIPQKRFLNWMVYVPGVYQVTGPAHYCYGFVNTPILLKVNKVLDVPEFETEKQVFDYLEKWENYAL